jgi:hypothetical protein
LTHCQHGEFQQQGDQIVKKLFGILAVVALMFSLAGIAVADDSAAISKTSYNEETKVLTVEFEKYGTYEYAGVPADVNAALEKAESKGAYFNENIRGKYTDKKISD